MLFVLDAQAADQHLRQEVSLGWIMPTSVTLMQHKPVRYLLYLDTGGKPLPFQLVQCSFRVYKDTGENPQPGRWSRRTLTDDL